MQRKIPWQSLLFIIYTTALLILLNLALPYLPGIAGMIIIILFPAIIVVFAAKSHYLTALSSAFIVLSFLVYFAESSFLNAFWLVSCGMGLAKGFGDAARKPPPEADNNDALMLSAAETFLPGLISSLFAILAIIIILPDIAGMPLTDILQQLLQSSLQQIQSISADLATEESLEFLQSYTRTVSLLSQQIQENMLFLVSVFAVVTTFASWGTARVLLRRLAVAPPPLPSYNLWRLPSRTIIILMITFIPLLIGDGVSHWFLDLLSSVNQLIMLLCLFLGLAVVDYHMQRRRWPRWFRLIVRPLLFITTFAQTFLLLIGMLDIGFNLRRLKRVSGSSDPQDPIK